MVHNRYQQRGGEDESFDGESAVLRSRGHEVFEYIRTNANIQGFKNRVTTALRCTWSISDSTGLRESIRRCRPDLVHVQNFFPQISPAVYYAAKKFDVPVVQSLRNYRILCPNGIFFRQSKPCEDCLGKAFAWPGVVHGCYRESHLGSLAVATMSGVHRLMDTWSAMVDRYICLTEFSRGKFVQAGFPEEKLDVKPNFVSPDPAIGSGAGGYAIFVGRLAAEKGVLTLLDAWRELSEPIPLKIVGDGPLRAKVKEAVAQDPSRFEWLGTLPASEVYKLMGGASFLVFPSEWYETFGRVAIEAFATGTPVIASKIGAIAEIVAHGRTGLHFRPGDPHDLGAVVAGAVRTPDLMRNMREAARAEYVAKYTAGTNYSMLLDIYAGVMRGRVTQSQ